MKYFQALTAVVALTSLVNFATAQVLEDFEAGNPNDWGWDYNDAAFGIVARNATIVATGGNPNGFAQFTGLTKSGFPVNFLWARNQPAAWEGDFRALNLQNAGFDYRHNSGFPNFGFPIQLILADDRGTPNDFYDDVMAIVFTGTGIQIADQTWHTITTPVPSSSTTLPAGWSIFTMPLGTNPYANDDAAWNAIIQDVDYVTWSTGYPNLTVFGTVNIDIDNITLDFGSVGTPYCFCDGSGLAAPCGNASAAGRGCDNSVSSGGALLTATGAPSVAASTVTLDAIGGTPNVFGVFFQGEVQVGGGAGALFNDGFLCTDTNIIRLEIVLLDGSGSATSSVNVAVAGAVPPLGATRNYQLWYRDPVGGPCSTLSNTSNALQIVWVP